MSVMRILKKTLTQTCYTQVHSAKRPQQHMHLHLNPKQLDTKLSSFVETLDLSNIVLLLQSTSISREQFLRHLRLPLPEVLYQALVEIKVITVAANHAIAAAKVTAVMLEAVVLAVQVVMALHYHQVSYHHMLLPYQCL